MKIRIGKTRIVIIIGCYAFKVVRVRCFDFICKIIKLHYHKIKFGNEFAYKKLHRHSRTQLLRDMFLACFLANYREHRNWKRLEENEKCLYVPTLFTMFYIINIQERDDVASPQNKHKFIAYAHNRKCGQPVIDELNQIDNKSANGRILDYGHTNVTA